MSDPRQTALVIVILSATAAAWLMADAVRQSARRGALEWRRGRLLDRAIHPGPFRIGLLVMRGSGLGFLFGAVAAVMVLLSESIGVF